MERGRIRHSVLDSNRIGNDNDYRTGNQVLHQFMNTSFLY
jgi:hypothetical protein